MIPFTQTKVVVTNKEGEMIKRGNCLQYTIASLLGIDPLDVPNFETMYCIEEDLYEQVLDEWLKAYGYKRDSAAWHFSVLHSDFLKLDEHLQDYTNSLTKEQRHYFEEKLKNAEYIISGKSPRGFGHVAIYRNGRLLHDAHPTREGLISYTNIWHITRI